MEFIGNEIEGFPELSYIAAIGKMGNNISPELFQRVKRIEKADPQKNKLALDVRGLQNIKQKHLASLKKLQTKLNQIDWEFFICNLPSGDQKLFSSQKNQEDLTIFESKKDLLNHLEKQKETKKEKKEAQPLQVGLRTREGVRLFEGEATRFETEKDRLTVLTRDKNAKMVAEKGIVEAEIYFKSRKIQVLPHEVKLTACRETKKKNYNYRLKARLEDLNKQDRESLDQHFNGSY